MSLPIGRAPLLMLELLSLRSIDPLGPSDLDPDEVRDVACSITSSSRVCDPPDPETPDPPDLPDPPDPALAGLVSNLVLFVLVVLLLVGIAFLISRLVRGRGRAVLEEDETEDDLDESVDSVLGARIVDDESPPNQWRTRADGHLARGEFRDAIRCRYRALVGDLARAGYLDEIPGRTSGEERSQMAVTTHRLASVGADADHVAASFDAAASIFDAAWFDDAPVVVADHERFVAAERIVVESVVAGPSVRRRRVGVGR